MSNEAFINTRLIINAYGSTGRQVISNVNIDLDDIRAQEFANKVITVLEFGQPSDPNNRLYREFISVIS